MDDEPAPAYHNVSLNFDHLREANTLWVRRAYVFMGIGTNAADQEPLIPFKLSSRSQYDYGTNSATETDHKGYLKEFGIWVVANALRELVEGHSGFLIKVYEYLRIYQSQGITAERLSRKVAEFDKNNVLRRREKLARMLSTADPFSDMFASILQARNCFAHRNGVVGAVDVDAATGTFELKWRFHGLMLAGTYMDVNQDEPIQVEADTALQFGPIDRSKVFVLGEQIALSRHELAEIIFGVYIAAEALLEPFRQLVMADKTSSKAATEAEVAS